MFIATLEVEHDIEHARQTTSTCLLPAVMRGRDEPRRSGSIEGVGVAPVPSSDLITPTRWLRGFSLCPSSLGDDRRTIDGNWQAAARSLSRRSAI